MKLKIHSDVKRIKQNIVYVSAYKAQELLGIFTEAKHFGINKHHLSSRKLSFQTTQLP